MLNKKILRIALPTPLPKLFDYLAPQSVDSKALVKGVRILVPFQSRKLTGLLVEIADTSAVPAHKLKPALQVLDEAPILPPDIVALCEWSASYYHHALGDVFASAMPAFLRKGKVIEKKEEEFPAINTDSCDPLSLNSEQQKALDAILLSLNQFQPFLLDGVTGSGKTEVYLQAIAEVIKRDQQVLVLVPEISLTPQTIGRFQARFNVPMIALHSGLTDKARFKAWLGAKNGNIKIVIGTRSAIFTPFAKLGLIIVDEEHDASFKQQDRFRYHARDLSIMRARLNQIPVVLGSATPSLESLLNAKRNRYHYLSLPMRAGNAALPQFKFIDLRAEKRQAGLSETLLVNIEKHLALGNQVMLFLNKRGFAPVLYCPACQWVAECKRCSARMIYHQKPPKLKCHHCDAQKPIPHRCAACESNHLEMIGTGTQRVEEALLKRFPQTPIIRIDRDVTKRKGAMQQVLDQIHEPGPAILLGTQMLAKGHHFPRVTLVGILDADSGLFSADYRAMEQMGQLFIQVAGRAGRGDQLGTVMVQTQHPDHPLLQTLIHHGYDAFAKILLAEREGSKLPPFSFFAVLRAEAHQAKTANQFLSQVKKVCEASENNTLQMMGPVAPLMSKRKGFYCEHLLIKATERPVLQRFLRDVIEKINALPENFPVRWVLDVDPLEVT